MENEHPPKRKLTILVVEDELLVAMDIEMTLAAQGYDVLGPACSVDEALDLLAESRAYTALLDFNIRGQTVLPVAERLADLAVPIVLTSAYEATQLTRHAPLIGAGFVRKPFSDADLMHAVRQAIGTA